MDMLIVLGGKQRLNQEFSTHESCHSEREIKNFPKKKKNTKAEHHWTDLTRNIKESFSSWNKRILISNIKTYESIELAGKGKYASYLRIL